MKVKQNVDLDQLWLNYAKAYRNQVRLKHSINADNEINATLRRVRLAFEKQLQQGILPAPPAFAIAVTKPAARDAD